MAIGIGVSSKGRTAGATSQATTGVTTTNGSTIFAGMIFQTTFVSIADNKSNSPYVQVSVERQFDTAFTGRARAYQFTNATGGASHAITGTVGSSTALTVLMAEITGSSGIDTGATSVIDTASPYTTSITPTAGRRLVMALFAGNSASNPATIAESSGFTILTNAQELDGSSFWLGCLAYKIVDCDGVTAVNVSFTQTGATETAVFLAAFKESAGGSWVRAGNQSPANRGPGRRLVSVREPFASASQSLTLAIDTPGAITLAGQSMTMGRGLALSAQGAITVAGQSVTPALTVPVTNGVITLAGQAVTFGRNVDLATNGAISIAGQSVTPALMVPVTNGAVTLAGQTATFAIGAALANGAITFNGQTVALDLAGSLTLSIEPGAIALTGQDLAADLSGVAPSPPAADTTGGANDWTFFLRYEQERERRRRKRQDDEDAREAIEQIPAVVDREIAQLLHKQERIDEVKREAERLKALVAEFKDSDIAVNPRVKAALDRFKDRGSLASILKLDKELRRQLEDEEMTVLMLLIGD